MKKIILITALVLASCETIEKKNMPPPQETKIKASYDWDHKADSAQWTAFTSRALHTHGKTLLSAKAKKPELFCDKFNELNTEERVVFWTGLIAAMTRYESGFKPETTYKESFTNNGEPVISTGLLQISYASARGYGFKDATTEKLKYPAYNLSVGVGILNRWFGRDGYIATKVNGAHKGGSRYWSVLRVKPNSKLYKIRKVTKAMAVCK